MAKILRLRRGNTAAHSTFTGKLAEVTVDTTKNTIVVHDNATVGGHPLATESYVNTQVSSIIAGNLNFGDLDISGNEIATVNTNQDLVLSPNGTGNVVINGLLQLESDLGIRIGDTDQFQIRYREGDGNPWDRISITTEVNGDANIGILLSSKTSDFMFFNPLTGNIGINNLNPAYKFTVAGDVGASNYTAESDYTGGYRFVGSDVVGLTGLFHLSGNVDQAITIVHDGTTVLRADVNNYVSLTNLNVYGNAYVSGEVEFYGNAFFGNRTTFTALNANLQYAGQQDNYLQFIMQNKSNGSSASTDLVATADNGDDTQGFIDVGINGSNYSDPAFSITGAGDGYLYVHGIPNVSGSLSIGTVHEKDIIFHTGGTTAVNEIARFAHGQGLKVYGNITPGANVTYNLGEPGNEWNSLYVSGNTIFIGGTPLSVDATGNLIVNGNAVAGGGSVQPYLELTNIPFITLPVTLSEPTTITAAPQGTNARLSLEIDGSNNISNVTVTSGGTGYSESQIYRIYYYDVGGSNNDNDIYFTVDTVGENGEILTVTNVGFSVVGNNSAGTYTNLSSDYMPSVFDEIDTGLTLVRDNVRGLFNFLAETQYNNSTYASPLGTEWNSDGWGDLTDIRQRSYSNMREALGGAIGNNIIGTELVMHDTINDKYYKFLFTAWGENNGAFAYTRNEITDPNYFFKTDNGEEVDIFIPDDGDGAGVGITRAGNNGIYNPYRENGWNSSVSPDGTLWNLDGWDDLSDVETRTYDNFFAVFGNGGLGNKVPGSKTVMYVPDNGKYYAIEWLSWTQGGNGGGFSYIRRELDLTQLQTGVKFPDGTVLNSAEGVGRVKSTASRGRRIEEVYGSKTVAVTSRTTQAAVPATIWDTRTDYYIFFNWDVDLYNLYNGSANYGLEISLDNSTWYPAQVVGSNTNNYLQIYLIGDRTVSVTTGDTVYYRVSTGGDPVVWWDKNDLPGGGANFRGAVIDYHAYSGEATWIGTIHIVDDSGEEHIAHTEVGSGTTDSENDDLWLVQNEGTISYRRIDGEAKTLKVHWSAKVFYGEEFYD